MKNGSLYIKLIVMVPVLVAMLFTSAVPVLAGSNGQQIGIYACEASRVVIQGYNQNGQYATYTLNKSTSSCGWYNITGWWWKGNVTVTPYYYITSEYQYYKGSAKTVYIPTSQSSSWVNISLASPSARQRILWRAQTWVNDRISYNQSATHDQYRQDCSGYVSFAWSLSSSYNTTTILQKAYSISFDSLQPGDALDSTGGGHIILFIGWVNQSAGTFNAYEENPYYGGAHQTNNITLNKSTGKLTLPGYTYPGTYKAIRKSGL